MRAYEQGDMEAFAGLPNKLLFSAWYTAVATHLRELLKLLHSGFNFL